MQNVGENFSLRKYKKECSECLAESQRLQAEKRADYQALVAQRQWKLKHRSKPTAEAPKEEKKIPTVKEMLLHTQEKLVYKQLQQVAKDICRRYPTTLKRLEELKLYVEMLRQERRNEEFNARLLVPQASVKEPISDCFAHPLKLCQMLLINVHYQSWLKQRIPVSVWNAVKHGKRREFPIKYYFKCVKENIGANFKVITDYTTHFCHPMLLSALSPHFEEKSKQLEWYLPPCIVSTETFVRTYRWIIEPLTALKLSQLIELTRIASFMNIPDLRDQCWLELSRLLKRPELICSIYAMAKKYCISFERDVFPYFSYIFLPFVASSEFLELQFERVLTIFSSQYLPVNSEMEIFYAMLLWLDHDWKQRQCHIWELFQHVHLDMMPITFLLLFWDRKDCPPALDLIADTLEPQIVDMIFEIKDKPYKHRGNMAKRQRHWIYDSGCKYHHSITCNAMRFFTYSDFIGYLNFLQSTGYPSHLRLKSVADPSIVCCRHRK
ncbi:uncharacterized protein LOC127565193 isoform X1 [Drosophila albomicans]|uniref:Uncharacterized protein LOC127565193 isoform X1 n=2 Tax=Drosophila albomicans TaxID=7291 RepID=A0A9C6W883_DROAB|nr:uncharacterized protein LOC127565193 isoform X1 [Drosophila albomicans]